MPTADHAGRVPAPFVVGTHRSGTTLLRLMLDAHPELAIPPETHFVPALIDAAKAPDASPDGLVAMLSSQRRWADLGLDADALERRLRGLPRLRPGPVIRAVYSLYAEGHEKPRWGDKTPAYLGAMARIRRVLPEARFVHLIRDGRDVAVSRSAVRLRDDPPAERVARRWRAQIVSARRTAEGLDHYLEVRYEDLVREPAAELRRICEFTELEWSPEMLDYHERAGERLGELAHDLPSEAGHPVRPAASRLAAHALATEPPRTDRIGRWREELPAPDRAMFERVAGDLLAELGYELGS